MTNEFGKKVKSGSGIRYEIITREFKKECTENRLTKFNEKNLRTSWSGYVYFARDINEIQKNALTAINS